MTYRAKLRRVLLGKSFRRFTGISTFTGRLCLRKYTFSACRSSMAFIIAAQRNSVTVTPYSFALPRTDSASSMNVTRFKNPSGSGVPER